MPDGSGDIADIQTALTNCVCGDTILVAPGVFNERLVWPETNGLVLLGETTAEECILDGGDAFRHLTLLHHYDETTVIRGLTFQNGNFAAGGGGSILIIAGSPLIEGNIFVDNLAIGGGAITCANGASPRIIGNTFTGNMSSNGGGGAILVEDESSPTISGNHFRDNTSTYGGAIGIINGGSPTITENLIEENTADNGGGILVWGSPLNCGGLVAHNTIINNTVTVAGGGVLLGEKITMMLRGNLISGNIGGTSGGGIYCEQFENLAIIRCNTITENECINGAGIACRLEAAPTIDHNEIRDNIGHGIRCSSGAIPVIQFNDITGHLGSYGVMNEDAAVTISAQHNFWGSSLGPYHPVLNPGGTGDWVSDNVDFDPWSITSGGAVPDLANRPMLNQNRPNPFNPRTVISFTVPSSQNVRLTVHTVDGRRVATLLDGQARSGHNEVDWNGHDGDGRAMPSGIYFYRLTSGEFDQANRMILVR